MKYPAFRPVCECRRERCREKLPGDAAVFTGGNLGLDVSAVVKGHEVGSDEVMYDYGEWVVVREAPHRVPSRDARGRWA